MSSEGNTTGPIGEYAQVLQVGTLNGNMVIGAPPRERTMHSNLDRVHRLFTDREVARARVRRLVHERAAKEGTTLVTLHGIPGVGTSELARHLAFELADHYPDARIGIDLGGPDPDRAVSAEVLLDRLLPLCGAFPDEIPASGPAKRDLLLRLTAGKAFVLVLDNAVNAGQVRALLPGQSRCLVLVTSPGALPPVERADEEMTVHIPEMEDEAVAEILRKGLSEAGLKDTPDTVVDHLVGLCHGLPALAHIALGHVGEHNPFSNAEDLVAHLERSGGRGPRARVASYVEALPEPSPGVLRGIGAHTVLGSTVDRRVLGAALGEEPHTVRTALNELARRSLVHRPVRDADDGEKEPTSPVWFAVGGLVGSYAHERAAQDEGGLRTRLDALRAHYRDAAVRSASLLTRRPLLGAAPSPEADGPAGENEVEEARTWLNTATDVLTAVVRESVEAGDHMTAVVTAEAAAVSLNERGRTSERLALLKQGHGAAVAARDTRARVRLGNQVSLAHLDRGELDEARSEAVRSLELAESGEDAFEHAASLELVGLIAQRRGHHTDAVERLRHVRTLKEEMGRPQALAVVDLLIARSQIALGHFTEARARLEAALPVFAGTGEHRAADTANVAKVRLELGRALLGSGDREAAETELGTALDLFAKRDMPLQRAAALEALASVAPSRESADERLRAAADLYRDVGNEPEAARVEAVREGDDGPLG